MIARDEIAARLKQLGFTDEVLLRYEEPHRYYHDLVHVCKVVTGLSAAPHENALFLAAVYHDAIYDPRRDDNEEQSAKLLQSDAGKINFDKKVIDEAMRFIRDTKTHQSSGGESQRLIDADMYIQRASLSEQIEHEHQVFKEYQFYDYLKYREGRLRILEEHNFTGALNGLIEYVKSRKPQIGVFCGSFNPFHMGHFNVLQKAEKIFDKVIIAFGSNPEKNERQWDRPLSIQNRQIEEYNGLLTDFVASLGYETVVIRGLRNSTDFQYEQNQYRYIQELMPEIRIVNIFCDKEFEHISSSGIRTLEKFGRHNQYLLT